MSSLTCTRSHGSKEWSQYSSPVLTASSVFLLSTALSGLLNQLSFVTDMYALCVFTVSTTKGLAPDTLVFFFFFFELKIRERDSQTL